MLTIRGSRHFLRPAAQSDAVVSVVSVAPRPSAQYQSAADARLEPPH